MAETEIHFKLSLILRLVDTTTGKKVKERPVIFKVKDQILPFQQKEEGVYILLNHEEADLMLDISVPGYLPMQTTVCFAQLPTKLPEVEVPLIPETGRNRFIDYLTVEGKKPGITSVTAVSFRDPHGAVIGYQPRRQSLKLYYAKAFEEQSYAVLHEQAQEFEEFRVDKKLNDFEIRLISPLQKECEPKEKVGRIIRGKVDPDGHYLLRMVEEGSESDYLIRYVVNGQESFERFSPGIRDPIAETEGERS